MLVIVRSPSLMQTSTAGSHLKELGCQGSLGDSIDMITLERHNIDVDVVPHLWPNDSCSDVNYEFAAR